MKPNGSDVNLNNSSRICTQNDPVTMLPGIVLKIRLRYSSLQNSEVLVLLKNADAKLQVEGNY